MKYQDVKRNFDSILQEIEKYKSEAKRINDLIESKSQMAIFLKGQLSVFEHLDKQNLGISKENQETKTDQPVLSRQNKQVEPKNSESKDLISKINSGEIKASDLTDEQLKEIVKRAKKIEPRNEESKGIPKNEVKTVEEFLKEEEDFQDEGNGSPVQLPVAGMRREKISIVSGDAGKRKEIGDDNE